MPRSLDTSAEGHGRRAHAWRLELGLTVLVLITLLLILNTDALLRFNTVLTPGTGVPTAVRADTLAGGDSRAALTGDGSSWTCTLGAAYEHRFCAFEVRLDPALRRGIDMRRVETVRLWLEYQGGARSVRVFLRNHDARYSRAGDPISTKFNQIEVPRARANSVMELPLRDFNVANWWMTSYDIAPELSHPQFDNIVVLEVQTGTGAPVGEHRFRLRRIELAGRHLTSAQLYLGILLGWLMLIVAFIGRRLLLLKREVADRRKRELELLAINRMLDARGQQMEAQASTDALTGAFNRRGLDQALLRGLDEARGHNKPLSLILFDIDHFKTVNDRHGHAVGDRVLSQLSWLVQENSRESDLFARWGGEEFVILCRNSSAAKAAAFAEKLRALIAAHPFENALSVTASFGVATLGAEDSVEALFAAADAALYEAKRSGRNRVMLARREAAAANDVASGAASEAAA